jgi:signal transduction histidine kinase
MILAPTTAAMASPRPSSAVPRRRRPAPGAAEQALEALPAQVCLLDADGTIVYVNRAWRRFAQANGGDPARTAIGCNYLQVCRAADGDGQDDAARFHAALEAVLAGDAEHRELEYPCHSPTELRWYCASVTRVPGGEAVRALVTHQPVTAQRLGEARRAEAQRLQLLASLSVGLAHDFNNVLGAVLGNAAMALDELPDAHPAAEATRRIDTAARRARELVRRMLALGRGEPQPPVLQPLRPLVEEAITLLRLGVPAGVTLRTALADEPLWARVDTTDLQQAMLNLAHNAWHALRGRADATVVVSLCRHDASRVDIGVEDNGCGMTPAVLARVFEPFFTTRPAGEGTGLGLAQVQACAARVGGTVHVASAPGQGSCFRLRLPLAAAPVAAAADTPNPVAAPPDPARAARTARASAADRPPAPTGRAAGPRVLLVDDDEVVGLTLSVLLQRAGYRVHLLADPLAALDWLGQLPDAALPDLLITDHAMPALSGHELCRRVRQRWPALPLLLISGAITPDLAAGMARIGRSAVVAKEEASEHLLPRLRALLDAAD